MDTYTLSHLRNEVLLRDLPTVVEEDRANTALLLAHLAEVDTRRLYLSAACSSMYVYCLRKLHMSEDEACTRTKAARIAREFPALLTALAEGRLHLSAILLLGPELTKENAEELLAAAAHKSKADVQLLLARRFPQPDVATRIEPISLGSQQPEIIRTTSEPVSLCFSSNSSDSNLKTSHIPNPISVPERIREPLCIPAAKVTPLSQGRFELKTTIEESTLEKLREVQELLGHEIAPGDVAQVLDFALDAALEKLKKRKFAPSGKRRRSGKCPEAGSGYVSSEVKKAVWERDGGQCTFVSPESGERCEERKGVEFDHIKEVARGGDGTVEGMRLLCRAHNQHAAEQTFGVGFMNEQRERGRQRTVAKKRARLAVKKPAQNEAPASPEETSSGQGALQVSPDAKSVQ